MAKDEVGCTPRSEHPGPQKKIASKSFIKSPIHYLIFVAFILTVFSILKANVEFTKEDFIWNFELLDTKTAISILVATISLLYARNQFEQGFMPILDYRITYSDKNSLDFNSSCSSNRYLVCSIKNLSAVAVVTSVNYIVHTKSNGKTECHDYHDLIRVLKSNKLENKEDHSMVYISNGWSLGSNDERVIFELVTEKFSNNEEVTGVDIELEFRSLLGDIYKKEIFCIPRRSINL
ncbi:hypothetical protein [uncultured Marinobacter sp.]|uniref:hypothetical protein n=1 Tax=uncultured Marinobacter sp. TaxID=187379 RepID=UPI0030DC948F|tara:strand:- start:200 stop:904 length:705 start_codon:yes stop_codon:yes gene_type:complete